MSVFLSYSRQDGDVADLLYRLLQSKGYDVWMDRRNIDLGSRWDSSIEEAIRSRTHVVVVLSPESVASDNVADEWSFALEESKIVVPLYYRECSVPMRLRRLQRVDFAGKDMATAFQQLTSVLGDPDHRPTDEIELARRKGFVFIDDSGMKSTDRFVVVRPYGMLRIALVYADYPTIGVFLSVVWQTMLRTLVPPHRYGADWVLRNKVTGHDYLPPDVHNREQLLHEFGIEPNTELTIVLLESDQDE